MTAKEALKANIVMAMRLVVGAQPLAILENVLIKELAKVEVAEVQTLPATVDDTNEYIMSMFYTYKAPKLAKKTVEYYADTVRRLICYANKPLTKVTSFDIEAWLESIRQCNAPVSLNNNLRNLSAFFSWMRKSHLIIENPCDPIEPYTEIDEPIDHMEPEEYEQLKDGCKTKRDRAMIEVLRSTAMRVGEFVSTNICDVDWRTGTMYIYGQKGKAYRIVCLDSVAIKYLEDYLDSRGVDRKSKEPLFTHLRDGQHERLSDSGVREAINKIKVRAELERRVYPHLFRKTTATNIVKRGGSVHDAGEYLGHKDNSTAGRHYAYIGKDHTIEIFRRHVAIV